MSDIEELEMERRDGGIRSESFTKDSLANDTVPGLELKEKRLTKILSNSKIHLDVYAQLRMNARKALLQVQLELNRRAEAAQMRLDVQKKILCISTCHAPSDLPDWGDREVWQMGQGWLTFAHPSDLGDTPDWLQPIDDMADELGCMFIWFDCDNIKFDELPQFEWTQTANDPAAGAVGEETVRNGDGLDLIIRHLVKVDKATLVEALSDIISRTGYDEHNQYDELEQVVGSELFDSIRFTLRTKLKIVFP